MSEHPFHAHVDPAAHPEHDTDDAGVVTGHDDVDQVVASLDGLDERPVSEHIAVFEAAHDRLRNALADAGNDPSGA